VAANIDEVFVVTAVADPAPIPQLLDRLLVVAEVNSIPAAVVINKVELAPAGPLAMPVTRAATEAAPTTVPATASSRPARRLASELPSSPGRSADIRRW
jgi:ribosome biogenesis GTPase